jgi:hypothetical protein
MQVWDTTKHTCILPVPPLLLCRPAQKSATDFGASHACKIVDA